MPETQEITEFDLSLLPGWDEELKCESSHDVRPGFETSCTVEATHRMTSKCNGDAIFICQGRLIDVSSKAANWCARCGRTVDTCWTVVPV